VAAEPDELAVEPRGSAGEGGEDRLSHCPPPLLDDLVTVRAGPAAVNIALVGPHASWIESLSPWPEEYGLERMHALLDELGHPERKFPSVHVVGTNGKSTATRTIAELLRAEGLRVGAYTSPHVSGWEERLDTDVEGLERALGRIRPPAERLGATQFEALTAAALAEFAAQGVDVAVIEAGLGGRLDATNVVHAPVVHLTNISLEHTDVLGESREAIAREKLAVASPGATVVLGEPEWARLVPECIVRAGGAREAAEAFLGRPVTHDVDVRLPGRLEWRGADEVWDGAHTPEAVDWLLDRLPDGEWVIVASVLRDKDVDTMLARIADIASSFVATRSSSARALTADELADRARRYVSDVVAVKDPVVAVRQARELGPRVLVTGSLYLLADLHAAVR
jgi:dihydrofolate synthase / folylpolyglutamate synthase